MQDIIELPMGEIRGPQVASRITMDAEKVESLAASMKKIGLLYPVIVKRENGGYEVVAGDRRFNAAKHLKWEKLPCIVMDADNQNQLETQIAENGLREDLSPIEEAVLIRRMKQELKYTNDQTAEMWGKTVKWCWTRERLLDFPEELQVAIHLKDINPYVGNELAKIEDDEIRENYLQEAIRCGSSAKVVASWAQGYVENKELVESIGDRVNMGKPCELPPKSKGRCIGCAQTLFYIAMNNVWICPVCFEKTVKEREEKLREISGNSGDSGAGRGDVDKA